MRGRSIFGRNFRLRGALPAVVGARGGSGGGCGELRSELLDGVRNYSIAVKKRGDDITFLRRIVPGGADDSYGIEVAKLAGVPNSIIKRAKEILADLESGKAETVVKTVNVNEDAQLSLMGTVASPVVDRLRSVDLDTLTPIEAMNLLYELKYMI